MYHRASKEVVEIAIAAPGSAVPRVLGGPAGRRRTREGSVLDHCLADCRRWLDHQPYGHQLLLENPSARDLESALSESRDYLLAERARGTWSGGGVSIQFSGHGACPTGAWSLRDAVVTARDVMELLAPIGRVAGGKLGLELMLDSCFSGAFFCELMLLETSAPIVARDMAIGALPSQEAWELDELGHGAHTFAFLNRGNAHVNQEMLAEAVRRKDDAYVRLATQGFVPNPVTYLTEGDQTSFELVNGHLLEVEGAASFEVHGVSSAQQLADLIERASQLPYSQTLQRE